MRGVPRSTCSWKLRASMAAASTHSGMLTKKIHRQVTYSDSRPPRVGPTTAAIPHTLAMYPWTLARSAVE